MPTPGTARVGVLRRQDCYSWQPGRYLESVRWRMWVAKFAEQQAKRLYPRRIAIVTAGTGVAIAIRMIPRMLRGLGQYSYDIHVLRFAVPVLVWSWSLFFLCVWFHPRRGIFPPVERVPEEPASRQVSILRAVFLGMLFLLFLSPLVLWAVLLL